MKAVTTFSDATYRQVTSSLSYRGWVARGLAYALVNIHPCGQRASLAEMNRRAEDALGESAPWLHSLVEAIAARHQVEWELQDPVVLGCAIFEMPEFAAAFDRESGLRLHRLYLPVASMLQVPLASKVQVPAIATIDALASWLNVEMPRLDWLCGPAQRFRPSSHENGRRPAQHFRAKLRAKSSGGYRLLEIPKAELKAVQRRLLDGVLMGVPVHAAAYAYVPGRSVVEHAALHSGRAVVMHFDLTNFFTSICASRVHAIWHTLGYPRGVARALTSLCMTQTDPAMVQRLRDEGAVDWAFARRLAAPHLPQGSPTSAALANLSAYRLDCRLEGLANAFGASYSRYSDDLVFSGPQALAGQAASLRAWVAKIVESEGFSLNLKKTRVALSHSQQRVGGLVVNAHPNVSRNEFDRLKATLHRCVVRGPGFTDESTKADLRAKLLGKIAWVGQTNRQRQDRLMKIFDRIRWSEET